MTILKIISKKIIIYCNFFIAGKNQKDICNGLPPFVLSYRL